ncbi:MAG: peptidoglycan-associated lipoprotein Pal [Steroidobacteraceae bacterium]
MRWLSVLMLAVCVFWMSGCAKKPTTVPGSGDTAESQEGATGADAEGQVGTGSDLPGTGSGATKGPEGAPNVIYFDFDSSEIRAEFGPVINAHARHLAASGATQIRLEGHTDERGSREYNIALAERRAQAVRRALMLQGAGDKQLTTVSYGEERPAVQGSDESAYDKNRRVELVYGR